MDYRGKILYMDLTGNGHARRYVCTSHCNGEVDLVSAEPDCQANEYTGVTLEDVCVRSHWSELELIQSVKQQIRGEIRKLVGVGATGPVANSPTFNASKFQALQRNLQKLESLDGDQSADLLPPVPEKQPGLRPNYVGTLAMVEFPLDSDAAHDSGLFIIVAQSEDSLYAVKADSCVTGAMVGRIPFVAGDEAIKILSVTQDDQFIREFIERLDDMTTEDYPAELCDAAETVSRQLLHLISGKEASRPATDALDRLFAATAADPFLNLLGRMSGCGCGMCSCN